VWRCGRRQPLTSSQLRKRVSLTRVERPRQKPLPVARQHTAHPRYLHHVHAHARNDGAAAATPNLRPQQTPQRCGGCGDSTRRDGGSGHASAGRA
jgi:hypothetical protein